jgi:hypothetical protein
MPVKRRLGKQREATISPALVASYAHALEVRALGPDFRDEAWEAQCAVERALGGGRRRFFVTTVFDVIDHAPDPGDPEWDRAADLKRRLDEALAAARAKQTIPAGTAPEPTEDAKTEAPVPVDVDP